MAVMAYNVTCDIVQSLCVLSARNDEWSLEFNLVKWNDNKPKYDIRPWNNDHTRCGKGITLSEDELKKLVAYCNEARLHEI
jgi:hypothetical protein